MNHRVGFNKLGLKSSHRKALHRNMATSLFRYERITTTKAKALAVRRTVEKMITRAKVDSVHNRRILAKDIGDKKILTKLFTELGPRYASRPGGYTRVLKLGWRKGDAAETVILELVQDEGKAVGSKKKNKAKKKENQSVKETVTEEVEVSEKENVSAVAENKKTPLDEEKIEDSEPAAQEVSKEIQDSSADKKEDA